MILINNAQCGLNQRGVGIAECYTKLGIPDGFIAVDTDWVAVASAVTIDKDYILEQIKLGNFVPFNRAVDVTANIEEDVFKTYQTGQKKLSRKGLAEFVFTYTNGREWHAAASSNDHSGSKAAILIWKSGHIGLQSNDDGKTLRGLSVSHQTTSTWKDANGTDPGETMISIQFTDTQAYNENVMIVDESDSNTNYRVAFSGALDTYVEVVGTPGVGDTTINVKLSPYASRSSRVAGVTDFTVSDQAVASATYDAATGISTITLDALTAGSKTIQLGTETEVAAEVTGKLYSGGTVIVVA